jgi:eukaryotic-like serine/threonine-protein kinase
MGDVDPSLDRAETGQFGGYVTNRVLGSGGMGTVYEARHPTLGRRVAVKVIKGSLAGDPVAKERFLREAQALALVSHPHVVDVFDVGIEDGRAFIVMELLDGETLEALLARKGRIPLGRAVELLLPLISATAAIHETGVVHRDLKPANIMLARRGRVAIEPVILDFGISRAPEADSGKEGLTEPQHLVGTLPYLSPEQMRDGRAAGPFSDQYALGVMLYECITGEKPFSGGDRYELMHAAMTAPVTAPSALVPGIPAELDRVVLRAMTRRPEARYPSVRALGSALLSFADQATWKRWAAEVAGATSDPDAVVSSETLTDTPRPPDARGARHRRLTGRAIVAAGASVLACLVLLAASRPQPTASARAPHDPVEHVSQPTVNAPPAPANLAAATATPPVSIDVAPGQVKKPATRKPRQAASMRSADPNPPPPPAGGSFTPTAGKPAERARADDAIDPFAPVR